MSSRPPFCDHDPAERWVALDGGKVLCARCAPPVVPHRRPCLRDYDRRDVLAEVAKAREGVRAAIRSREGDGEQLARLLAPIADLKGAVDRGRLGMAESYGRQAVADLRSAGRAAPNEVAACLRGAAEAIEGVVG